MLPAIVWWPLLDAGRLNSPTRRFIRNFLPVLKDMPAKYIYVSGGRLALLNMPSSQYGRA